MQHVILPKQSKTYRGRYTLGNDPKVYDVSLGTRDRETARFNLRQRMREHEQELRGEIAPRVMRETTRKPVGELFTQYEAELVRLGRSPDYIKKLRYRLPLLFKECGWRTVGDVKATGFLTWRRSREDSPKNLNHYQDAARGFLNWLRDSGMLQENPLARVKKLDNRLKEQESRRAFTADEIAGLLRVASPRRRFAYLLLVCTGLRVKEARALEWRDVDLSGDMPCLRLRADTTKARRGDVIQIPQVLADEL